MDESNSTDSYTLEGQLIALFDPTVPIYAKRTIAPSEKGYYLNVELVKDKNRPQVLAGASRVSDERVTKSAYSYIAKSPIETTNISRVLLPKQPKSVLVNGQEVFDVNNWDAGSKSYLLGFENNPDGIEVKLLW